MLYAVLNKDLEHKFAIRHLDRDYINNPRVSFYLDVKNDDLEKNVAYLASLYGTDIVNIEIYDEINNKLYDYSSEQAGHLLELSDRLENLLIGGGIERTLRAVITYEVQE